MGILSNDDDQGSNFSKNNYNLNLFFNLGCLCTTLTLCLFLCFHLLCFALPWSANTNENKIKKIVTDLICFIIYLYLVHCIRLKKEVKVKIYIFFVIAIAGDLLSLSFHLELGRQLLEHPWLGYWGYRNWHKMHPCA